MRCSRRGWRHSREAQMPCCDRWSSARGHAGERT
jgi:hypothetical protein